MLVTTLVAAGTARADEEKVALDRLPRGVLQAVKKRFPKAELLEAAKETENGKTEYEVTIKDAGARIDVMLTPAGVITLIEKEIPTANLPKAVKDALETKFPKATYKIAEEVIQVAEGKEKLIYHEVLLQTKDRKTIEAKVSPEGKIEVEVKSGKDKD